MQKGAAPEVATRCDGCVRRRERGGHLAVVRGKAFVQRGPALGPDDRHHRVGHALVLHGARHEVLNLHAAADEVEGVGEGLRERAREAAAAEGG